MFYIFVDNIFIEVIIVLLVIIVVSMEIEFSSYLLILMIEISNIVNLIIGNNRLIVGMFMIIIEIFF